ncbi:Trehalase [Globisporangium polare]
MERVMDIYCRGPILHAVQMANVFSDSKHFVDMPIKANSSAFDIIMDFQHRQLVMTEFRPAPGATRRQRKLSHEVQLRDFVHDHFDPPGSELSPITPFDYQELMIPPMIAGILDDSLRDWAFSLHRLWRTLGRMPNPSVRSSYLHAKPFDDPNVNRPQNVLIVPGGRFRESYYWDSYWIVQGLLVSNMQHTARGVVNNLLEYVAEFGFVPNGGRIYYLTRSQPPMLSDMVKLIAEVGHNATMVEFDASYLNSTVPILEKEYRFWMQLGPGGHAIEFVRPSADGSRNASYLLNRYTSSSNHPRPESFREDVNVAAEIYGSGDYNATETESKKDMYYNNIIAAAESGWDFSSRWLGDKSDMKTMLTSCIIPVDLNAIMYRMEKNLETFHEYLGNPKRAEYFRHAAEQRILAMNEVLWSDEYNTWKDFNIETLEHSDTVTVSDYTPLWAKAFDVDDTDRLEKVVKSLKDSGLLQVGGIQTTNLHTGQQWDAPNAWAPEQDIVIEGLLVVNTKESHELARELIQSWILSSLTAWRQTGLMFEKYNASEIGGLGVGGEYFPQFGFGWTNGVILKFLTIHQNLLLD